MRKIISGIALATGLVVGLVGIAHADVAFNDVDATIDNTIETVVLAPGETKTFTLKYENTNQNGYDHDNDGSTPNLPYADAENACGAAGDKSLVLNVASSNTGVATLDKTEVSIAACGGTATVTATAVGAGTAEIRFTVNSDSTATGTQYTAPADFDVQVVAPDAGRDAPAIANEYLHEAADQPTLDACRSVLGTNRTKSNWHGNLISGVAQYFEGQTFTSAQESIVIDYLRAQCGLA